MARAEAAQGFLRTVRGFDPFLAIWRLLTSVRFALGLIGFLALAGLVSVLLPQIPAAMRENPAAVNAWVELQKDRFGPIAELFYRWGLFNVFSAKWFLGALALLVVSVCVCTANRLPPIWRTVTRPQHRVPETFFERAGNRVQLAATADTLPRLEGWLKSRRFKVRRFEEGEATYLFADRFSWSQLATFVSHLALIMFLAGGLISRLSGFTSAIFVAEGTTSPVFAVSDPKQMQVEVLDAVGQFDESGTPVDYRTKLVIYQGGREVARGESTVNDPLEYGGYRFHQAAYFGEGAALRVRDAASGRTLYSEVLELRDLAPAPLVAVRDAGGDVLLEDIVVPTDSLEGARGTLVTLPGVDGQYWLGVRQDDAGAWQLIVYGQEDASARFALGEGQSREVQGLDLTFVEATGLPTITAQGIPGDEETSQVVLSETPDGQAYLTVQGATEERALILFPDRPVTVGGREYEFEGRREFAGIEVRRDPGATFIWVAVGLLLAGLLMTFYLPRLRLWVRLRDGETVIAGLGDKSGLFRTETKRLAADLGLRPEAEEQEGDSHG